MGGRGVLRSSLQLIWEDPGLGCPRGAGLAPSQLAPHWPRRGLSLSLDAQVLPHGPSGLAPSLFHPHWPRLSASVYH